MMKPIRSKNNKTYEVKHVKNFTWETYYVDFDGTKEECEQEMRKIFEENTINPIVKPLCKILGFKHTLAALACEKAEGNTFKVTEVYKETFIG